MRGPGSGQSEVPRLASHLVLAGGGHSHALLLQQWLMRPQLRPARSQITLVNRHSTALYSGTLPALVAGLVQPGAASIDLRRLATRAGVTWVEAEIEGLDPARRELRLRGRPPLRFDRLSLDVGAVTACPAAGGGQAVKPLEPFLAWLEGQRPPAPVRIRGGGAAAVELALALRARGLAPCLLLRGRQLRLGSPAANRLGERLLAEAGIALRREAAPQEPADLVCTGSRAPAWLAAAGLPVDPASGRVLTEASLEVIGHGGLFASGDCGLVAAAPRPASGVWAVRAAPLLARNLRRSLEGPAAPLHRWRPQPWALQLLGDGGASGAGPRAVAFWGPWAWGPHPWLWRWKRHLDQRFLVRLAAAGGMAAGPFPSPTDSSSASVAYGGGAAMACRGCAAKLAAAPLQRALARLPGARAPGGPEDAPLVATLAGGALLLQSVDGFPALVADPFLNARLTTLHACGDLWASGAAVASVQALVTLPEAEEPLQEEWLLHTLAGVRSVLDPLGARLLGGHTLVGRDGAGLALALCVNGTTPPAWHWGKGPLRPGDALLLAGPLGSGVLFAAAMAGEGETAWLDGALARMQRSQAPLVAILAAHGCRACTDITGFGLLGHLGEMLQASPGAAHWVVELEAGALPAYPGALELLGRGWSSSLAPANAQALALLEGPVRLRQAGSGAAAACLGLLVDPQTCGPLLAALPAAQAAAALEAMRRAGFAEAAVVGRVLESET